MTSWNDRLYRAFLVVSSAAIGGLAVYWVTRPFVLPHGASIAALWYWGLTVIIGYASHRLLPENDLSAVTTVLLACLMSAGSVIAGVVALVFALGGPPLPGLPALLLVSGVLTIAFASAVLWPVYVWTTRIGRYGTLAILVAGALVPGMLVFSLAPFGSEPPGWRLLQSAIVAALGALAALTFDTALRWRAAKNDAAGNGNP